MRFFLCVTLICGASVSCQTTSGEKVIPAKLHGVQDVKPLLIALAIDSYVSNATDSNGAVSNAAGLILDLDEKSVSDIQNSIKTRIRLISRNEWRSSKYRSSDGYYFLGITNWRSHASNPDEKFFSFYRVEIPWQNKVKEGIIAHSVIVDGISTGQPRAKFNGIFANYF